VTISKANLSPVSLSQVSGVFACHFISSDPFFHSTSHQPIFLLYPVWSTDLIGLTKGKHKSKQNKTKNKNESLY